MCPFHCRNSPPIACPTLKHGKCRRAIPSTQLSTRGKPFMWGHSYNQALVPYRSARDGSVASGKILAHVFHFKAGLCAPGASRWPRCRVVATGSSQMTGELNLPRDFR